MSNQESITWVFILCPRQVRLGLWRRYFRPNEGHMVQGLAPSGCSYLAGKPSGLPDMHSCTPHDVTRSTLFRLTFT